MTIFYSVTFKIITIFHIFQYQERKLYQREANKTNMERVNIAKKNDRRSNFRQRLTEIYLLVC